VPELLCFKTQKKTGSWLEVRQKLAVFHFLSDEDCRQLIGLKLTATELTLILTWTDPQLFLKLLTQVQC
jgi:hypothetical protein